MHYIVLDTESTCWKNDRDVSKQEIIEIGAIKLNENFIEIDHFSRFVKPILSPILSDFCKELTTISQKEIDKAENFSIIFTDFLNWIGEGSYTIVTWGDFDIKHFEIDCKRHKIKFPNRFVKKHINLKMVFADRYNIRPCGLDQAVQMLKIKFEGSHHRAIDDARNTVKVARVILPS